MFSIFKKSKLKFVSPVKGKLKDLCNVCDEAIASRTLGDGFAVEPLDTKIVSPIDGKVTLVFKTLHAIILENDEGESFLIHIGLDTVNLKGEGFKCFCEVGKKVKKGELLMDVDFPSIKDKVTSCDVIVLAQDNSKFKLLKENSTIEACEKEIVQIL
ncbi:PTS glucose transporter subunit IIA [Haloimpatiens sp. FM7315]|uniref:PTS sugar transporter subunit IIA n=1 Tax=Haloimpatiens sp. FM7315 TaxID=3298609 RepID=UPI00370B1C6F